jgi:hypothetical protein
VPLDLSSVYAKLQRAEEHAQALKAEVRPWMDDIPYRLIRETNADGTRHSIVARVVKHPPLLRWSLMIADSIHNLRSALDHLVYTIALHESGQDPPPAGDSLMFPICDTPTQFKKASKKIQTLSDPVQTAIEKVQPYNRPHTELPVPLLSMLRDFENTDKHKVLRLAFATVYKGELGIQLEQPIEPVELSIAYGEVKDGTELFAITFDQGLPNPKYDKAQFDFMLALWHAGPPGADRDDFAVLLDLLVAEVKAVVGNVTAAVI